MTSLSVHPYEHVPICLSLDSFFLHSTARLSTSVRPFVHPPVLRYTIQPSYPLVCPLVHSSARQPFYPPILPPVCPPESSPTMPAGPPSRWCTRRWLVGHVVRTGSAVAYWWGIYRVRRSVAVTSGFISPSMSLCCCRQYLFSPTRLYVLAVKVCTFLPSPSSCSRQQGIEDKCSTISHRKVRQATQCPYRQYLYFIDSNNSVATVNDRSKK